MHYLIARIKASLGLGLAEPKDSLLGQERGHSVSQTFKAVGSLILTLFQKKIIIVFLLLILLVLALYNFTLGTEIDSQWENFKRNNNRAYMNSEVDTYRYEIFLNNLAKINAHNAGGANTYSMGITPFTDLTEQEFSYIYLTLKVPEIEPAPPILQASVGAVASINWVASGKVSSVKNQGNCGSCWAFSANAAAESAQLILGSQVDLSEQQLVDCTATAEYGNSGCNGGWMGNAFYYMIKMGVTKEAAYPYKGVSSICSAPSGGSYKLKSYTYGQGCSNVQIMLTSKPLSVAVDATNWPFYTSGIFSNCGTTLNHGVLLVGSTSTYWTIKNTWSIFWGEAGYIRLAYGNTCGICYWGAYPNY